MSGVMESTQIESMLTPTPSTIDAQQYHGMELVGEVDGDCLVEDTVDEPPIEDSVGFCCDNDSDEGQKDFNIFNHLRDFNRQIEFVLGMIFISNEVFMGALRQYAIESSRDYYYLHNDKSKVTVYCMNKCDCLIVRGRKQCTCNTSKCQFQASATNIADDGTFHLKTFVAKHDCTFVEKNTKIRSEWLADKWLEYFRDDPTWKIQAFQADVKRKYRIEISYNQAWKAKRRALLKIQGDAREEYRCVWNYATTIRRTNPGSSYFVKVDICDPDRPLFQRIYVSMVSCIKGFKEGCRPFIGVDGCHLKGGYTGQILTAVGTDGTNNIYPIAFAVVEAERRDTWAWFLSILMKDIQEVTPTFISDRQKGLMEELNMHVTLNKHRVCVRHFYENFKQKWSGSALKDLMWAAAYSCTKEEFTCAMNEIKKIDEKAFEYLMRQSPLSLSRHAFEASTKTNMLLNNVCESFNAMILPARNLPVLSLCEWIRRKLMTRFVSKRESMLKYKGSFTPYATQQIEKARREVGQNCRCIWGGGNSYEVFHRGKVYVVDIDKKSCDCFKWNLTGIPCPHAMCCIIKRNCWIDDFVNSYYHKDTFMKAYGEGINAMPRVELYDKTENIPPEPPKTIVQPGRPKKNARRRGKGEEPPAAKRIRMTGIKGKCTNCHQIGHNKRSCKNSATNIVLPPGKPKGRPNNPNKVFGSKKKKS